jgi:hypothetical protein
MRSSIADSITLERDDTGAPASIPRTDIATLERYAGRKGNAGKGAGIGALSLGVASGIARIVAGSAAGSCDGWELVRSDGLGTGAAIVAVSPDSC